MRFQCSDVELDRRAIRRDLRRGLRAAGLPDAEISLLFVDDEQMRSLNLEYRGISRTTDVLAFPQNDGLLQSPSSDEGPPLILGDIVISLPTARRQCSRYSHSIDAEIRRLMAHGIAHLFGHDHKHPLRARKMRAFERDLLKAMNS